MDKIVIIQIWLIRVPVMDIIYNKTLMIFFQTQVCLWIMERVVGHRVLEEQREMEVIVRSIVAVLKQKITLMLLALWRAKSLAIQLSDIIITWTIQVILQFAAIGNQPLILELRSCQEKRILYNISSSKWFRTIIWTWLHNSNITLIFLLLVRYQVIDKLWRWTISWNK